MLMESQQLLPGLADPVQDSQQVFRIVLDAMAHPGRILRMPVEPDAPAPLMPAAAALCLTLLDFETPLWLRPHRAVVGHYLRFHCGCPLVDDAQHARFAVVTDAAAMPDLAAFHAGDAEYPDRSATLIVQVEEFIADDGVRLSGPGIANSVRLGVAGLHHAFWQQAQLNHRLFPCGIDMIFVSGDCLAALPRTIKVEI